jgi:exonuclease III
MAGIITYLSILTLNVNGPNSPVKRHHLTNWIKKEDPTICCLQETHFIDRNKHWLRVKGWKKISQWPPNTGRSSNTYIRQSRLQTYIGQRRQRTLHTKKGAIHQKKITITNLYAPNVSEPNFIKHTSKYLKEHIDFNTVVVGYFNTPLSPEDRSSKQKVHKEILELMTS